MDGRAVASEIRAVELVGIREGRTEPKRVDQLRRLAELDLLSPNENSGKELNPTGLVAIVVIEREKKIREKKGGRERYNEEKRKRARVRERERERERYAYGLGFLGMALVPSTGNFVVTTLLPTKLPSGWWPLSYTSSL